MPLYYIDPKPIKIPNLKIHLKLFSFATEGVPLPQKTIRSIGPVKSFKSYNILGIAE
jgi:hypothetical protein